MYSSGDEDEYNHELENSTESFENEMNKIRENIERKRKIEFLMLTLRKITCKD